MSAADLAFRAQLVIPEQRRLYDYWIAKFDGDQIPARRSIRPGDFIKLLPWVSVFDCHTGARGVRVRLAGTKLRDVFGKEITGLCLQDYEPLAPGDTYWPVVYERVLTGVPAQGVLPFDRPGSETMTRFWLRLPLRGGADAVEKILGYDCLIYPSKLAAMDRQNQAAKLA